MTGKPTGEDPGLILPETERAVMEKYWRKFENTRDVYYEADMNGTILDISRSVEKMSHYRREELIGRSVVGFYEDPEKRHAILSHLRQTGKINDHEVVFNDKTGDRIYCSLTAQVVSDEEGASPRIIGILRDITDRKQAEESLRASQKLLQKTFASLRSAVFIIDFETSKITECNLMSSEMFGYSRDEILGRTTAFLHVDEASHQSFRKQTDSAIRETGASELDDFKMKRKNGEVFPTDQSMTQVANEQGNPVTWINVVRDISGRKVAEESLKKRERELEVKSHDLEEMNMALKVLIKRSEEDRIEIEKRVLSNVRELVLPYVERLKQERLSDRDRRCVHIIETNLQNIVSPFLRGLSSRHLNLTTRELQVAVLVRDGKTSKEIADLLNVSVKAIDFHRNSIRNKLDLKNKKANLRSYLRTYLSKIALNTSTIPDNTL